MDKYIKLINNLPSDIIKNIVSEYLEYDEIINFEDLIPNLIFNPKRIKVNSFSSSQNENAKTTFGDGQKIKYEQYYDNGNKRLEMNYKNGKLHGKQYYWLDDSKIVEIINYENGELKNIMDYSKSKTTR
jgi:hypothetical protein